MSDKINQTLLQNTKQQLSKFKDKNPNDLLHEKKRRIHFIISLMLKSEDNWLSQCPFSYRFCKESFEESLKYLNENKNDEINDIYYIDWALLNCIHFFREANISHKRKNPRSENYDTFEIGIIWLWFIQLQDTDINSEWYDFFYYIKYVLSTDIINSHIGEKSFQAFLNFEDAIHEAEHHTINFKNTIKKHYDDFDVKIQEVKRLEEALKTYKEGFNFVGLSNGFSKLLEKKEKSKECIFWLLIFIGSLIIGIPFIKLLSETEWKEITWQQLSISIGLEFILIYFFRVVLNHYRSTETQIMQLELRLSLCQFIQNYAEYAKEIKTNDKEALEKFENLIFSSILSNDNNIPSTFDGMEQITQLIKEVKGK